jgi:hypothetical protein
MIFVLLTLLACDPSGDARLMFENNSSVPIIFTKGLDNVDPDKSFVFYDCSSSKPGSTYLESGKKNGYPTSPGGNWETTIPRYPNGTITFLTFQADSAIKYINNYGCDSLGKRKDLILKRFDVTLDYLNKNNWTLTYP